MRVVGNLTTREVGVRHIIICGDVMATPYFLKSDRPEQGLYARLRVVRKMLRLEDGALHTITVGITTAILMRIRILLVG